MNNPWEEISLDVYENHMSLASVNQLQTMNLIMKEQFEAYPVETAMVLGIAGGKALVRLDYQNAEMRMVLYDRAYKQQVFDFTKECFDELGKSFEPDGRHSFYNDIENKFIAFYVGLKDDTVIGTVALKKFDHDTAELKSLYLRKEYRGRGYGKRLLDTVIRKAREEGFRYLVLDSMSKYKAALGLYESIGFVPIDRYNDNTYADIFMRLEL